MLLSSLGMDSRNVRYVGTVLMVIFAIAIVFVVKNGLDRMTYRSYEILREESKINSTSRYEYVDGRILRYSVDGATLMKTDFSVIWNESYTMNDPKAAISQDRALIYDSQGTSCRVYRGTQREGAFETKLPILKAAISSKGTVAVIMRDGSRTQFVYYSSDGAMIASGAATMIDPGYPVNLSLSPDGKYAAISYVTVSDGKSGTEVRFFDFSKVGRNEESHVSSFIRYEGILAPELYYLDNSHSVIIRENGFDLYKGTAKPKLEKSVDFKDEIVSTFHDGQHLVFLFRSKSRSGSYRMTTYTVNGKLISSQKVKLQYQTACLSRDQILFYQGNDITIYSMKGFCRFVGRIEEGNIGEILKISRNRYLVVTDEKMEMIRLV